MSRQPKLTNYVSEVDQFFHDFNKNHLLTASQSKEKEKYLRIYRLRDTADRTENQSTLWEGF